MNESKRCPKCEETKSPTEFGPDKRRRDGLFPYCRSCARASVAKSQAKYREKYRERAREKYRKDPASAIARAAKYHAAHPDRTAAYKAAWILRNPDKRRAANRRWQQANMSTTVRANNARRRAARAAAPTIRFTQEQVVARVAYFGGLCWICRAPYEALDHVKPLTKGGWHCLANLRPICTPCNTRKLNHWPYTPLP